ncbi:energy transducer TonB [Aurantiacibacter sp. MUD61]|uniref:energy transducer TonB n=1 Tax=Aurantiacibacter sp. MUD61 TaxID=3009083 RepID=UPI0022F1185B|nr:hypothetical protein [Aurantiacibacter sp. MUD61]
MDWKKLVLSMSCGVTAVATSPSAAQDGGLVLEPTSEWTLEALEDSCAVRREFSSSQASVTLEMRQFDLTRGVQFILYGNGLDEGLTRATYRVHAEEQRREAMPLFDFETIDGRIGVGFFSEHGVSGFNGRHIDATIDQGYEAGVEDLTFYRAFRQQISLQTGPLHEVSAEMRACVERAMVNWNIDAESHRLLAQATRPNKIGGWVEDEISGTWPRWAFRTRPRAFLHARMIVSEDGEPLSCEIVHAIGSDELHSWACERLMEEARFHPALGAEGQPIRSFWTTSLVYRLD